MTVYFENECGGEFGFPIQKQLEILVRGAADFVKCPFEAEVSVTLADREKIRSINREYRGVDNPTDVLSFPMMEYDSPADFAGEKFQASCSVSPETGELILGDIVLCAPVVSEQAEKYGHSELREFSFLVVHSMLHLFGYDHMEDRGREMMEDAQRTILDTLGISR